VIFNQIQEELIKKEFSHLSSNYLNSAYFGPTPYRAKQKVANALFKELDPSFFQYSNWIGIPDRIRTKISQLFNLSQHCISLGTSTTDFVSGIAQHFPINEKLNVVSFEGEYPSNVLPWLVAAKNRPKLHFELINRPEKNNEEFNIDWLEKNLPKNTHILNMSLVQFDTGRRICLTELKDFLQKNNIFFILDTTQSLGAEKLSQEELSIVDVMVCSTYKWMLGPYGQAFAYFSPKAQSIIPRYTGSWIVSTNSKDVSHLTNYTTKSLPGARVYDRGQSPNMLANACLEASLELFEEIGLESIQKHNHYLRDYFLLEFPKEKFELVTPEIKKYQSSILAIKSKSADPIKLENELKHRNIDVSVREGKLRLSFHLFNTKKQIDELLEALDFNHE